MTVIAIQAAGFAPAAWPFHWGLKMREAHPLADLLPTMAESEYLELRESIRVGWPVGLPILLHRDGRTLDGRHRDRACDELGLEATTETFEGSDAEALARVLALNLTRRHLSIAQRALIAARLATLQLGSNQHACGHAPSQEQAAEMFGVSRRVVQYGRTILARGEPELIAAVESGLVPIKSADALAKFSREKQLARIERDQAKANGTHRPEDDWYRTTREAIEALLKVERFQRKVFEPACGDGAISVVLKEHGHIVISRDLHDRGFGESGHDFLTSTALPAKDLVTNPPYHDDLPEKFVLHALKLGARKVAVLCRLPWLESLGRYRALFSLRQLARVWVFSPRVTLWRGDTPSENDGGMTAYAWFVFERSHQGPWTGDWIGVED
jgi:hypothetical protein